MGITIFQQFSQLNSTSDFLPPHFFGGIGASPRHDIIDMMPEGVRANKARLRSVAYVASD